MMLAARAWTLRFGPGMGGWQRAVSLTGGLLAGVPPPPVPCFADRDSIATVTLQAAEQRVSLRRSRA
jgi:hypothetical protein